MEKIIFLEGDKLDEINALLQKGGKVKTITAVPMEYPPYVLGYVVIVFD